MNVDLNLCPTETGTSASIKQEQARRANGIGLLFVLVWPQWCFPSKKGRQNEACGVVAGGNGAGGSCSGGGVGFIGLHHYALEWRKI